MRRSAPLIQPTSFEGSLKTGNLGRIRAGIRRRLWFVGRNKLGARHLFANCQEMKGLESAASSAYVSYAIMALNAGAIFGYLSFGPLADRFGRRPVFAFMCIGSVVMLPTTYLLPTTYSRRLMLLPLLGFFNNGIFSGFPIYLPELYPTRLRATGAGFCFNAGRVLASASPFLTGWLVTDTRHIRTSCQHGGIDLSAWISGLNLRTGDQGQTAAGIDSLPTQPHIHQALTSHQRGLLS